VTELESMYSKEISNHRSWLNLFDKRRGGRWKQLLKSDPEAAICEASMRQLLSEHGITVEPYESLGAGGPDFICKREGKSFFTEVTCVKMEKVTSRTNLADKPTGGGFYGSLTDVFLSELCNKVTQCSDSNAPCVVAISTLHFQGGALCFGKRAAEDLLTGTTKITWKYNAQRGQAIGDPYESTSLQDSAFIRFVKGASGKIEFARNPVSAVILCAFRPDPAKVVGALHPNPNHQFERSLLLNIEFGRIVQGSWDTGCLKVEWI